MFQLRQALIIPLKKPSLSDNEIKDKISKNILKPLKKPKKTESIKNYRKENCRSKKC